jgi:hypothetical protein
MKDLIIPNLIPATHADIQALEQRLDVTFPSDYKQFLHEFNGGKAKNLDLKINMITQSGFQTSAYLDEMFGIQEMNHYYDMIFPDDEGFLELDDTHNVVIGLANGGSAICLCIQGQFKGKIYHYDGDFRLVYLADSLEQFFCALKESE